MLVFALGTLPLMLSFGTLTSLFSKDSTKRLMKLSGVFVIVLGVIMTNRGLAIGGLNLPFSDLTSNGINGASMVTKAQIDNADGNWEIVDYKKKKAVSTFKGKQGINQVDFKSDDSGTFGIYQDRKIVGIIEVVDDLETTDLERVRSQFL